MAKATPRRINVDEARNRLSGGALLVCAYQDEQQCRDAGVEGSLTLRELERRLPGLPKTQELIFFCG